MATSPQRGGGSPHPRGNGWMTTHQTQPERRLGLTARAWTVVLVALIVAILEFAPRLGLIDSFSLPPLSSMVTRAGLLLVDPEFLSGDLIISLTAVALSFVIASVGGVMIGLVLWRFPVARRMVEPWLATYYAIPTFALFPLLVVMLGVGLVPIVALATLLAIVAVITATMDGLDSTPRTVLRLGESLRLSPLRRAAKILLPAAVQQINVGLRLALSYSLIGVLASEFVLSTSGLGHFISNAYNSFAIVNMYAGILIVFLLALLVNMVFGALLTKRTKRISG